MNRVVKHEVSTRADRGRFTWRIETEANFAELRIVRIKVGAVSREIRLRQKQAEQQRKNREAA